MPIAKAHVETERATRYLAQLCRHFSHLDRHETRPGAHDGGPRAGVQAHVEWSETQATVSFRQGGRIWGTCNMEANPDALALSVEAPDPENLERVRDLVTDHVERFGRVDGVTVDWQDAEGPSRTSARPRY